MVSEGFAPNRPRFRPSDFPVGSIESRAAARACACQLRASREPIRVVVRYIGCPEKTTEYFVETTPDFATSKGGDQSIRRLAPRVANLQI
jgi:hypothetical protein